MKRHLISLIVAGLGFVCLPIYLDWIDNSKQLRNKSNQLALNGDPWQFAGSIMVLTALHLLGVNRRERMVAGIEVD